MEMLARIRLTAPAVGEWLDKNVISALSQFITSPSGRGRKHKVILGEGTPSSRTAIPKPPPNWTARQHTG